MIASRRRITPPPDHAAAAGAAGWTDEGAFGGALRDPAGLGQRHRRHGQVHDREPAGVREGEEGGGWREILVERRKSKGKG
jgi:hypothetical protein